MFECFSSAGDAAAAPSVRMLKLDQLFTLDCPGPDDLNTIYRNIAPYLYPFIIEFCILIVGIFYMIWANINHCPKKLSASGHGHGSHNGSHGHNDATQFASLTSIPEEGHHHQPNGHAAHAPSEVSDHCNNLVEHEYEYKSQMVVYADCHAASRGLFGNSICLNINLILIQLPLNKFSLRFIQLEWF